MNGSTTVLGHLGPSASTGSSKPIPVTINSKTFQLEGSAVSGGAGGPGGPGGQGGKRPLAHIDDITSVTTGLDLKNTSIGALLQKAEENFRQACSSRSFGRIDLALKDYIRANEITVGIPYSAEWPSLKSGSNRAQLEKYNTLVRQLSDANGDFMRIKAEIKADNARTGIQPSTQKSSSNGQVMKPADSSTSKSGTTNGAAVPNAVQNGSPQRPAPSPSKVKPIVHPKPSNLHGKALNPGGTGGASGEVDQALLQRFANLRAGTANRIQDPRIRTQPFTLPPPNSPPVQEPPKVSYEAVPSAAPFVDLPRVPAAIYNPARGTLSSEAAELPSSSPRAIFTRTNSMTSSANPNRNTKAPISGSSNLAQRHVTESGTTGQRVRPTIPAGDTISAEDLFKYINAGAKNISILLMDIRTREEFDAGHIMSQATICLEAEVLTREHISANQILDSMVLAPKSEQVLFEKRHEFDLMVFYDQDSKVIPSTPITPEQKAVLGLYDALSQYDFAGAAGSTAGPKLLEGGLEAWTDLVGLGSLQSSSTAGSGAKSSMAQAFLRRRPTYAARPIQDPDEAKRWKDMIDDSAISHIRTTEDFLRRFPAISPIQESMVSPISPISSRPSSPVRLSHEESYYASLPSPPARPPPAVPRRSHSGLAETETSITSLTKRARSGATHVRPNRTGLENPHNHCFANSVFQSLFATPGFARELWSEEWKSTYPVPRSPDERIDNPQLLTKFMAGLFRDLDQGAMKWKSAKTLMNYIYHIHSKDAKGKKKPENEIFGGQTQQDANEFYYFLTDNIHDETNRLRNRKDTKSATIEYTSKDGSIIQHAMSFWRNYSLYNSSIIDKYFRGVEAFISRCQNPRCGRALYNFAVRNEHVLKFEDIPQNVSRNSDAVLELEQLLQYSEMNESVPEGLCEACKCRGLTRKYTIARMPDRLIFSIGRFTNEFNKVQTKVRFPIRDLDLTRYMAQPDPDMKETNDIHFAGPQIYDCYAVTVHQGTELRSGHYYSYVQDDLSRDPTDWFKCNDTQVERVRIGSTSSHDVTERMYKEGTATAYQIFYKRRGT
ncbi:ubiquitin carboxyl-terminal hydrolase 8 [Rhypophila decipiens]